MSNRFATFADPEDVAAPAKTETKQKVQKETKKVVIKAKETSAAIPDEEFDRVGDKPAAARGGRGGARGGQRGGDRGSRGGARGGQRGGDREGQRGGDRGGRGRGRPRTAAAAGAGAEGEDGAQVDRPKTGDKEKRFHKYTGKAREEAHPYDKKSGTGRGKRDQQKGGHGKGNWGNDKKPDASETTPAQEKPEEETKKEQVPEEEPVQYEEIGLSIEDFLAQKQATSKGLLKTAGGRTHEKTNTKGIEVGAEVKRITTIKSEL